MGKADYKRIDGITHKRCRGICHPSGGAYVSLENFRLRKTPGNYKYRYCYCRECDTTIARIRNKKNAFVPIKKAWPIFAELLKYYSQRDLAVELGCTWQSISTWKQVAERGGTGYTKYHRWRMKKEFVAKAINLLKEKRLGA